MTTDPGPGRLALATGILALLLAGAAGADSWMPFANHRAVSPSGRRYVVIRSQKGGGIRFELCERRAGAPPMMSAEEFPLSIKPRPKPSPIDRDPEDRLLASGTVKHEPYRVHVLEEGGFVLFETYASLGHGNTISYVDERGIVLLQKKLAEIYGAVPTGAVHSESSIWWERGHWIDRERKSVVLVSVRDELREVSLETGKVTSPDLTDLLRWCRRGTTASREMTFGVLSRMARTLDGHAYDDVSHAVIRRAMIKVVSPVARKIVEDLAEPIALRLCAAIFLVRSGAEEKPGTFGTLFLSALGKENPEYARFYSAVHLPEILGVQARVHLQRLMRDEPKLFDNVFIRRTVRKCRDG